MSEEKLSKLLEQAFREGMKFGRQMETSENKDHFIPIAINGAIKWRIMEILSENKDG